MAIEIIAIISPKSGNEQRVREGLAQLADQVKNNEPNASRYQVYEQADGKGTDFFVIEEYASEADHANHNTSDVFKDLVAQIQRDDLLAGPLQIKVVKKVAGFISR